MRQLSPAGQQAIDDIARRHAFSVDAVVSMLDAVINGNGGMAQFSHPEFGGSGQWMRGGMIMLSDMFNNYLKGRVDGLCLELAGLVANQPDLLRQGSFQSQSQGYQPPGISQFQGTQQQQDGSGPVGTASLFVPPPIGTSGDWWPAGIGWPSSTGSQNNVRYAWFADAHRLAIDLNGTVTLYDTLDHMIGGFSQQQSWGGSLTFSSQYGLVDVATLPVISVDGVAPVPMPAPLPPAPAIQPSPAPQPPAPQPAAQDTDIFATIEKLAALHAKGILDDDEFRTKKAELLSRL